MKTIAGADAPFDICWDHLGIPHVYATTIADAYRGMGYVEGYERLWQIHLSCLYANGNAAQNLGERFVAQDALHRAFGVPASYDLPESPGDWVVDAYLEGLNAYVDTLDDPSPEFRHTGALPRRFTRADVAARYRFTNFFQHRSWPNKLMLGRLMATHGVEWFRRHVLRFSDDDEKLIETLREPLRTMNLRPINLLFPDAPVSGSNNWVVTGALSASGKPMLAMDPHQAYSIPNTFFYVHLHAPGWDVFGASFPGVPYFMMGYTKKIAWGLTTGFVDNYDVYVEEIDGDRYRTPDGWADVDRRTETIEIRDSAARKIEVASTRHGPLLEPLTDALDMTANGPQRYQTAVSWNLTHLKTSAGALALLPLAEDAAGFGDALFEGDVCPLVNNIICVDTKDDIRRFVAATLPARKDVTGMVPLPGWDPDCDFRWSRADELLVEQAPASGFALTANNDTMGDSGPFPIHNFPTLPARAERIRDLLEAGGSADGKFTPADFERMQLDLYDHRARDQIPDILTALDGLSDEDLQLAATLLRDWDCRATVDSAAACLYYPFVDRVWQRSFMMAVLDDDVLRGIPLAAPGLNRFDVNEFLAEGSPWRAHREALLETMAEVMKGVVRDVRETLGEPETWAWGRLHQVRFWHSLRKHEAWKHMQVGPDPVGGSGTTLAMALHVGNGPGRDPGVDEVPCRANHGAAYRLVVDLGDPDHCRFVICGGNGGRPESPHVTDHYRTWLAGGYYDVTLARDELRIEVIWEMGP